MTLSKSLLDAFALLALEPDAVGFSVYVWNRELALEIAGLLGERRPDLLLLAGGAEVTADPEGMKAEGVFDLVLPGEGEELLVQVVGRLFQGHPPEAIQADVQPAPVGQPTSQWPPEPLAAPEPLTAPEQPVAPAAAPSHPPPPNAAAAEQQLAERLVELDTAIAREIDEWAARELPQIIARELDRLIPQC